MPDDTSKTKPNLNLQEYRKGMSMKAYHDMLLNYQGVPFWRGHSGKEGLSRKLPSWEPTNEQSSSRFFTKLPLELRRRIYEHLLSWWPDYTLKLQTHRYRHGIGLARILNYGSPMKRQDVRDSMEILYTCKRINDEASEFLYRGNMFDVDYNLDFVERIGKRNCSFIRRLRIKWDHNQGLSFRGVKTITELPNLKKLEMTAVSWWKSHPGECRECILGIVDNFGLSDRFEFVDDGREGYLGPIEDPESDYIVRTLTKPLRKDVFASLEYFLLRSYDSHLQILSI